jgi:thermitase
MSVSDGVLPPQPVRSWLSFMADRSSATELFHPAVDEILRHYRVPVWVTREYSRANHRNWSPEEIQSGLNNIYRLVLRENLRMPRELIDRINLLPFVRYARLGRVVGSALPAMEFSVFRGGKSWPSAASIGLEDAHGYTQGDQAIRIAVLDTGVCLKHPDLRAVIEPGFDCVDLSKGMDEEALKDFVGDSLDMDPVPEDEVGHGTHVSGIIAGQGKGMPLGVAPRCRIVPVRALAAMRKGKQLMGAGLEDNINSAVKWAVDHGRADVLNMSLGIKHEGGGLPHKEVVDYARRKGVSIVAASGNDGRREYYYPGALRHVIATAAADEVGQPASFSTYGDQVSIMAPGTNIYSSFLDNGYAMASGTSQAAPFVTGAIGLMKSFAKQLGQTLRDSQIKHVLKNTADKVDKSFKHPKAGFGQLNISDAMRLLEYRFSGNSSRKI